MVEFPTPQSVDLEVVSAMRRLARVGLMQPVEVARCLVGLRHLGIMRCPLHGLTERIWELRDNSTPYDAAYVALAEALDCALLTADAKLAAAPGADCQVVLVAA